MPPPAHEVHRPVVPHAIDTPAPPTMALNRLLRLEELEIPGTRAVLDQMDDLVRRDDISYLHPSKRWEYPWALGRADLPRDARVLDVGCGDSIFPVYLAKRGFTVTGLDLDLSGRLGAVHDVAIDYLRGDMTALPLRDATFDAVFCISVIEHLPESRTRVALRELRRILKPGGMLLLTTDFYKDSTAELWYEGPDRRFPVDWGFFDEARLREVILDAPGFQLEGDLDLDADWSAIEPRMLAFHGYPYTSVGLALRRTEAD